MNFSLFSKHWSHFPTFWFLVYAVSLIRCALPRLFSPIPPRQSHASTGPCMRHTHSDLNCLNPTTFTAHCKYTLFKESFLHQSPLKQEIMKINWSEISYPFLWTILNYNAKLKVRICLTPAKCWPCWDLTFYIFLQHVGPCFINGCPILSTSVFDEWTDAPPSNNLPSLVAAQVSYFVFETVFFKI